MFVKGRVPQAQEGIRFGGVPERPCAAGAPGFQVRRCFSTTVCCKRRKASGVVIVLKGSVPQAHEGSGMVVFLEATSSSQTSVTDGAKLGRQDDRMRHGRRR